MFKNEQAAYHHALQQAAPSRGRTKNRFDPLAYAALAEAAAVPYVRDY